MTKYDQSKMEIKCKQKILKIETKARWPQLLTGGNCWIMLNKQSMVLCLAADGHVVIICEFFSRCDSLSKNDFECNDLECWLICSRFRMSVAKSQSSLIYILRWFNWPVTVNARGNKIANCLSKPKSSERILKLANFLDFAMNIIHCTLPKLQTNIASHFLEANWNWE